MSENSIQPIAPTKGQGQQNQQNSEAQRALIRQYLQQRGSVDTPVTMSEVANVHAFMQSAQAMQQQISGGSIGHSQQNNVLSGASDSSSSPVPQVAPQGVSHNTPFGVN